ncbi:unnamed protein product [Urochloa humidicola]
MAATGEGSSSSLHLPRPLQPWIRPRGYKNQSRRRLRLLRFSVPLASSPRPPRPVSAPIAAARLVLPAFVWNHDESTTFVSRQWS